MSYLPIYITVAFVVLAAFSTQGVKSKPQKKISCRFDGKEYSPGDLWYPANDRYCIRCSCALTGKLNCTSQQCPSECSSSTSQGSKVGEHPCCKSCLDMNTNPHHPSHHGRSSSMSMTPHGGDSDSIPPATASANVNNPQGGGGQHQLEQQSGEDDEDESFVTENSEFVSCLHQGKIYRDGDSFTANVSGLPISAVDQCMQCVCQSGMVLCQMKSCSSFKCSSTTSSPLTTTTSDTCCQRCSAWRSSKHGKFDDRGEDDDHKFSGTSDHNAKDSKDASISIPIQMNNFNSNSLTTDERRNRPGVPPDSSITFRDFNHLNSNTNGRDSTKKQQMDDCISGGRFYMHGSSWHPIVGPFGIMECVICKCTKGQIDCGRLKCPAKKDMPCSKPAKVEGHCCPICTSTASVDGSKMCVSGKQDLTAFRSHGFDGNGTELIQFGFVKQRQNSEPQVDQHEWALRDGEILQFTTRYMTTDEFLTLRSHQIFILLGATNEKNLEKFTRREKKLEKRCTSRCSVRITGLERSLRIHRLTSRKQCLTHERAVST